MRGLHESGLTRAVANSLYVSKSGGTLSISGLTTTGLSSGLFGYVSSNNTISATDNAALSTSRTIGAYEGISGSIQVEGIVVDAQFTTAGGSPAAGSAVWLAAASDDSNTGAGKLTAIPPSTIGTVVAQVGICLDNSNYASLKTATVILQIKPVIVN